MSEERLHRLVAVDADGRPIGVISAMDFVALAADRDRWIEVGFAW